MIETMIPPQLGMRLRTEKREAKEAHQIRKEKEKKREKKKKNMREKREGTMLLYLFPHLCFKVAPYSSYRESHMLSLSYTSGNFSL